MSIIRVGGAPHVAQAHRLGFEGYDDNGDSWIYCETTEDLNIGAVIEDVASVDGTVSTLGVIGENSLTDAGEFTGDDYRGATLEVYGDTVANGAGQSGWVQRMVDANVISVIIEWGWDITGAIPMLNTNRNGGWIVAPTTAATYKLRQLGTVRLGSAQPNFPRGIAQHVVDFSVAPFFWAKRTGEGVVTLDVSDTDVPVQDEPLLAIAGGLVQGLNATVATVVTDPADTPATVDALRDDLVANALAEIRVSLGLLATTYEAQIYSVGRALIGDVAAGITEDVLTRLSIDIPVRGMSRRVPLDQIESLLH